ncbi:hypothetical protein AKJ40_00985 [candidate division MSBL1 archaeon SCGC-AAA259M10]|uniref:DUF8058 domain-containing protein n=2 Tax=candidate division MSBL1 TaxID=215777 RepID=A0A133V2J7_9EURY|nr:hypothetical protein AKJ36_00705 [candidate division MSBL1 archaeon SCGC-AAA259I07]KXB00651.1 hypothetical protein AKJ40_00985 [candidate division MSBL1 archaeon SCGC-AAA259M10]
MEMNKKIAIYPIIIGLLMIGMWSALLGTGQVSEVGTALLEISYHLVAEFLTAVLLIVGGFGLYGGRRWGFGVFSVSMGLLLYSVINSTGYYAAQGDVAMVGMFTVLTILTALLLIVSLWKWDNHR